MALQIRPDEFNTGERLYWILKWVLSQELSNAVSLARMLIYHEPSAGSSWSHEFTSLHLAAKLHVLKSCSSCLIVVSIDTTDKSQRFVLLMIALAASLIENCKILLAGGADVLLRERNASPKFFISHSMTQPLRDFCSTTELTYTHLVASRGIALHLTAG